MKARCPRDASVALSLIVTLSGASGVGKTTIAKELLKRPDCRLIISTTTRAPRSSDAPGEYRYVSEEDFSQLEAGGKFLWHFPVHGIRVGTLKEDVDAALATPGPYFLMLLLPETLRILLPYAPGRVCPFYLCVPSRKALIERLTRRGDDPEVVARRVRDCRDWDKKARASGIPYHFIANNRTPEIAAQKILRILAKVRR